MVPSALATALAERYSVERQIGEGGMATVFLANDLKHRREVAIKVLKPELAASLGTGRFLREIEIAARLTHPHILPLHDSGEAAGFLYYVMPYVSGESLRARLAREGELPIPETVRILRDVVDALAYAHGQGVVHRDMKPDNVLMADRHAMVTDFGVAKAVMEATGRVELTGTGMALGTPLYIAPEQASGEANIDGRADLYAVGVLAYEMLTGRPPFAGANAQAVVAAHLTQAPTPVMRLRGTVPDALSEIVMRCLAKRPADRWRSADELLARIEALSVDGTVSTPAVRSAEQPPSARRRRVAAIAGVAILAAAAAAVLLPRRDPGVAEEARRIAIVPFAPTVADTALARIGRDLVVTLSASLDGVGGITTVDGSTMLAQAVGRTTPYALREAVALARTLGGASVLHGSLLRSGTQVRFEGQLVATSSEQVLARVTAVGPLEDIGALSDSVSWSVLRQVWPTDHLPTRSPHGLTTRSLAALRAFLEGEQAVVENRWGAAANAYARAIEADSAFWLAYLRYSRALSWHLDPVPESVQQAIRDNRAAFPERERVLLEIDDAETLEDRLRGLERVIDRFPDHWFARFEYADRLVHVGPLGGYTSADAQAALEQTLTMNPAFVPAWDHLYWVTAARDSGAANGAIRAMIRLGADSASLAQDGFDIVRYYRLLAQIDRAPAQSLRPLVDTLAEGFRHLAGASPRRAGYASMPVRFGFPRTQFALSQELLRAAPASEAAYHRWFVAQSWMARGAWDSVLVALDALARDDATARLEPYAAAVFAVWLGAVEPAAAHQRREMAALAIPRMPLLPAPGPFEIPTAAARRVTDTDLEAYLFWLDGVLAAGARDTAGVRAAATRLGTATRDRAQLQRSLFAVMRGLAGDHAAAADELAAIESARVWRGDARSRAEHYRFTYMHDVHRLQAARWYRAAGDDARAARMLVWHENMNFPAPGTAIAYLERAQIEEARGDPRLARAHYEQFLRLYDRPAPRHRQLRADVELAIRRLSGSR